MFLKGQNVTLAWDKRPYTIESITGGSHVPDAQLVLIRLRSKNPTGIAVTHLLPIEVAKEVLS